jgi:hypothetical protein
MITYDDSEEFPGGITAYRMLRNMDSAMSSKEAETCHYIHMITTYLGKKHHNLNVSVSMRMTNPPVSITSKGKPIETPAIPRFVIHLHRLIQNQRLERLMNLGAFNNVNDK